MNLGSFLLTHCLTLPLGGFPLWFLLPLHRRAHIPHERGGAPNELDLRGSVVGEERMVVVVVGMSQE